MSGLSSPTSRILRWDDFATGLTLRRYQADALRVFEQRVLSGSQRTFHLVAPPGSGKTLLGLTMAQGLGGTCVCLSPTTALAEQWLRRLQLFHCVDPVLSEFHPHPPGSGTPSADALLFSLTNQSLLGLESDPSPRVQELCRTLQERDVRTLLLDECHHLAGAWGRSARRLKELLPNAKVIGLTATPKLSELQLQLLGEPDTTVSLPAVVRHGDLAPFQDLCHLVSPAAEEEEALTGDQNRFLSLYQTLQAPTSGNSSRFGLRHWVSSQDLEPVGLKGKRYRDVSEFFKYEPELVTSLVRQLWEWEQRTPLELPNVPEFFDPVGLADRLLLAAHYCAQHQLVVDADSELSSQAKQCLNAWGFRVSSGSLHRTRGRVSRVLGFSRQKLSGACEILRTEQRSLGADLRALVLTDYENPPAKSAALSCVHVLERLTQDPELDELDPVMLTGRTLLLDDDLWPRFQSVLRELCQGNNWHISLQAMPEQGFVRISGRGADWNTRTRVTLLTEMFQRGVFRCLISTRSLLGEGWDCSTLNTLVDLTFVTTSISVNQVRGRTLRKDPEDPIKVANNWDVVCLSPIGDDADWRRLKERHDQLYGVTDSGEIEQGLSHISTELLDATHTQLLTSLEVFNQQMHQKASNRQLARERWRVGSAYEDQEVPVVWLMSRSELARSHRCSSGETGIVVQSGKRSKATLWWSGGASLLLTTTLLLYLPVAAAAGALPLLLGMWALRRQGKAEPAQTWLSLARIVAEASHRVSDSTSHGHSHTHVTTTLSVSPRGTRIEWNTSTVIAERLSRILAELAGPIAISRYCLLEGKGKGKRVFAVPQAFSSKVDAQLFVQTWAEHRSPAPTLHHCNSKTGKELFNEYRGRRPTNLDIGIRRVWR